MTANTYNPAFDGTEAIETALTGRRIVAIERTPEAELSRGWSSIGLGDRATITLDDGTVLQLEGHDGGCSCESGCYELGHLADIASVDNIITAVHFDNRPGGDEYDSSSFEGSYSIFVVADNQRINLATFEGSDGNGYYGTGYYVRITKP